MANTKKTKGNTGNRYTDATKKKVVDFVNEGGRGSITEAMQKFGVSYIAIRSWMKKFANGKSVKPVAKSNGIKPAKAKIQIAKKNGSGIKQMISKFEMGIGKIEAVHAAEVADLREELSEMKEFFGID